MIKIKWNNECYEIIHKGRYGDMDVGCADYDTPISDHVQNIIEVLAACNVEFEVEKL